MNKFGTKNRAGNGRSPQRSNIGKYSKAKRTPVNKGVKEDRRSNSMNQNKFKSGKLRAKKIDFRSPQTGNRVKKKEASTYDFTQKLNSRAAQRGGSSARGHRNSGKSQSKVKKVPSYMGKRTRGYIG